MDAVPRWEFKLCRREHAKSALCNRSPARVRRSWETLGREGSARMGHAWDNCSTIAEFFVTVAPMISWKLKVVAVHDEGLVLCRSNKYAHSMPCFVARPVEFKRVIVQVGMDLVEKEHPGDQEYSLDMRLLSGKQLLKETVHKAKTWADVMRLARYKLLLHENDFGDICPTSLRFLVGERMVKQSEINMELAVWANSDGSAVWKPKAKPVEEQETEEDWMQLEEDEMPSDDDPMEDASSEDVPKPMAARPKPKPKAAPKVKGQPSGPKRKPAAKQRSAMKTLRKDDLKVKPKASAPKAKARHNLLYIRKTASVICVI